MSEAEPRRSVRSTKGQHKGLSEIDTPVEPKRRGSKKGATKKHAEPEPEEEEDDEEEEEIIRCVCGATSQDTDDPEDPWIACDECHAWQHNVCVGMSVFDEDLDDVEYFCEQCRPQNHKELLDGMKKGNKIWEKRRHDFAQEKAAEKKKKAAPKKGKKRQSETVEDTRASQKSAKSSASPAPEKKAAGSKSVAASKRKDRHDSADTAAKEPSKLRKVTENKAAAAPETKLPDDLPATVDDLPEWRRGPAKLLIKNFTYALKQNEKDPSKAQAERTDRLALATERAVHDNHGSRDAYGKQCRLLAPNFKTNTELMMRLLNNTLTPSMLAVMTSDDLQTDQQQQETAAAKERNVRQSLIATEEAQGPRYRRTHKGDELIDDSFAGSNEAKRQPQSSQKAGGSSRAAHGRKPSGEPMKIDTQQSPTTDFDINKVFSSVKSPTAAHQRRPSGPVPSQGPGVDPDVDRLLEDDDNDSDPYSPTEETDPDVIWRGPLIMAATANFHAVAKYVAGANLSKTINLPWSTLLPKKLNVGGRIAMNSATEYLCSMRWNSMADLIVVSLKAATDVGKADFDKLFDYFIARERWAVIGDKGIGNVKDTYLIPVPAGTGNQPEFLLNLEDNFLPHTRTENLLLLVIVYKNDENTMRKIHGPDWNTKAAPSGLPAGPAHPSPSPAPMGLPQRNPSVPGPTFSPTTPHPGPAAGFPPPHPGVQQYMPPAPQPAGDVQQEVSPEQQRQAEAAARQILGPFASATTLSFLMPHAHKMAPSEWHIIRRVLEREPKARDDLAALGQLIARESENRQQNQGFAPQQGLGVMPQAPPQQQPNMALQNHQQQYPSIQHTPSNAVPQPQVQGPPAIKSNASSPTPTPVPIPAMPQSQSQGQTPQLQNASPAPRQTPISLPPIPGMPASVHQSYQQAQKANQARTSGAPPTA